MKKLTVLILSIFCLGISVTQAQYSVVVNFNNTNSPQGQYPTTSVIRLGNLLYGTTYLGGTNNNGCIFSVDTNGIRYRDLWDFPGIGGRCPRGVLIPIGGKLYGMTQYGCIYRIDTNGKGFKDLWDFTGDSNANGQQPLGSLTLAGGKFYGMTFFGGVNDWGNVFSIDTTGKNYKNLWSFSYPKGDSNGASPRGSVTIAGARLFGMTSMGGMHSAGNIFSLDTSGGGYKDLWNFPSAVNSDAVYPWADLILSGSKLYGMTEQGGDINSAGTIFRIDTNGKGYKWLWSFRGFQGHNSNGNLPQGSLILSANKLYGMTIKGGINDSGNIFSIDTTGSGYKDLWNFNGTDGNYPQGSLMLSNNTLYGMTELGGTNNDGVVFSYALPSCSAFTISHYSSPDNGRSNGVAAVTVTGGASPYTYLWMPGGKTTDTIKGESSGTYTCTITDSKGCSDTAMITIKSTASINNLSTEGGAITVYPNPSNGIFTLSLSHPELVSGTQTIEIYNVLGERVYNAMLKQVQHDFEIDLSSQPNGVYFYRVIANTGELIGEGKLVKQ